MPELFKPLSEHSRREMMLSLFATAEYGSTIPYDTLSEVLKVHDRLILQQAVNSAKPALERLHNKAVVVVRNVGYRVALPSEHLGLARNHQNKSRRALRRGHSKVVNVDMNQLTQGERAAVQIAATTLALQIDYMRRNDLRVSRLEETATLVQGQSERAMDEVAELRARLEKLERGKSDQAISEPSAPSSAGTPTQAHPAASPSHTPFGQNPPSQR